MKRLFYFLLAAIPVLGFASCSDDDDDLPDVNFIVDISGGTYVDNKIYVVAGDTLVFDKVRVVNNIKGKNALITYAEYFWDYTRLGVSATEPFGFKIYVSDKTPAGNHIVEIYAPVYAEDRTPAFAVLAYEVAVVESADDIPEGGMTGFTTTPHMRDTDPTE